MSAYRCLQPPEGKAAEFAAGLSAHVPELETARLRLRAPRVADCPLWTAIWQGAEAEGPAISDEHGWEEFCVYTAGWLLHGHGLWSVESKSDGVLVGFVLLGLEWGDEEPELGWAFAPEARGQGFATEAAAAARDYAMALLGGAVSYIDTANTASARVAERLGARIDGLIDDDVQVFRHTAAQREARA
ncbi:MAG: GNAT family N-acetyltransferase [Pseudomonadota bacterium]